MPCKGVYSTQNCHHVQIIAPVVPTASTAINSNPVSLANWAHASLRVDFGVASAATGTLTLGAAPTQAAAAAGTVTNQPFSVFKQELADGDVLGARIAITAAGLTIKSTTKDIFYVIEIDAEDLPQGSPWLQLTYTPGAGGQSVVSGFALLSGGRFMGDSSSTVLV